MVAPIVAAIGKFVGAKAVKGFLGGAKKEKPSVSIKVTGTEEVKAFLRSKRRNTDKKSTVALTKATFFLQGEVKSSIAGRRAEPASVDTGRFLNSVDTKIGKVDAQVFSRVRYAKFLEFGTSRISPRRHFNNSKDRNKREITKIFQKQIAKI